MPKLPPRNKRPAAPKFQTRPTRRPRPHTPQTIREPPAPRPVVAPPPTGTNAPAAPIGLPVDPVYSNDIGSAQRTHDTTVSGLLTQRANTAAAYGYTPTYDEQGLIRSLAVDPNNPYAKANLLKKSYTEGRARSLNSMASRGQLYAGSYGVAGGIADEGYQQGSNALQGAFINFIANNQGQINSANTNYANALAGADSERVARASANDTGEYGTAAPASPSAPKPPKPPSKPKPKPKPSKPHAIRRW